MMAGNPEFCIMGIILHPLLDAANGDGASCTDPLFDQKDSLGFGYRPYPEIVRKSEERVIAHIDDPILGTLPIFDDDLLLFEVQNSQSEVSNLLHAQTAPEHQHKHGPIPMPLHSVKEVVHLFIPQVPGKGFGHLENMIPPNGIRNG
jgi:hypothetical protein